MAQMKLNVIPKRLYAAMIEKTAKRITNWNFLQSCLAQANSAIFPYFCMFVSSSQNFAKVISFHFVSVHISQVHVLYWVLTCIDHGGAKQWIGRGFRTGFPASMS